MSRILVADASAAAAFVVLRRRSAADTARWAALLHIVARAGRDMNRLGTEEVLEGVVGAVRAIGFESANISIIDEATATYRVIHAHGMPDDYVTSVHPATIGMTGMVRARRATVAGTAAAGVDQLMRDADAAMYEQKRRRGTAAGR